MPRTTLDIDATVLTELRRRQAVEGKTLGGLASELLAQALDETRIPETTDAFIWHTQAMGARVDLEDAEAVRRALDG